MNIINRSIKLTAELFPSAQETSLKERWRNKVYHFAYVYKKNRLLSIGQNYPRYPNNKVFSFAKRFGIKDWLSHPFVHAELDAISKLWGKYHIDSSLKFVVLRFNRFGQIKNSKPCSNCKKILNALDVVEVYWSNINGGFSYGI